MTQVLVFISENYIWFIVGIVLILLAVIGYYAEKTNFGQTKNKKDNILEENLNIKNMKLNDVINDNANINNLNTQINQEQLPSNLENEQIDVIDSELQDYLIPENLTSLNNDLTDSSNTLNQEPDSLTENSGDVLNVQQVDTDNKNSLLVEENFNKFSEEFNLILPEKEIINNDLLSDIEDLELGQTQKIDIVSVPDLDDIELPKIKTLVEEEQDIWKF